MLKKYGWREFFTETKNNGRGGTNKLYDSAPSGGMPINKGEFMQNQWSYEVKLICDHYSEGVLREKIIRFLKGAAAVIIWYLGLQTM